MTPLRLSNSPPAPHRLQQWRQRAPQQLQAACQVALDVIFPPRCAGCRTFDRAFFCPRCAPGLKPLTPPWCAECGLPFDPLSQPAELCPACRSRRQGGLFIRSGFEFSGPLRQAVHRFKYQGRTALAPGLAGLMTAALRSDSLFPESPATIVPVPLHPWRRFRRGYNQSELLAVALGAQLKVPVLPALRRTRFTLPQVQLDIDQRESNVRRAFAMVPNINLPDGPILLIDDVCTTGATLRACARVLRRSGVSTLYGLTLARQLQD